MEKTIYTREYAIVLDLLKKARETAAITQIELAKKLGVTQSYVSKIERGDRRLDIVQLRNLCRIYGMTLHEFVGLLENEFSKRT
jgi:transcriptional regulator with XRE-family HTH domain